MRKLTLTMAALATIPCLLPSDRAEALPFSSPAEVLAAFDEVTCRAPPWYRGLEAGATCAPIFGGGRAITIAGRGCTIAAITEPIDATPRSRQVGGQALAYFEDEEGPPRHDEAAHARRGAADRGQHRAAT
jgi:hypothetical protein